MKAPYPRRWGWFCGMDFRSCALWAFTALGLASSVSAGDATGDPRVQDRIYDHLSAANAAARYGNAAEATAYAEMVLLKRSIRVNIDDSGVPYFQRDNARQAFLNAVINWEEALGNQVRFAFVPLRDADVVVSYTDSMQFNSKEAAGTVRWTRQVMPLGAGQYDYAVRATMVLRTRTPRGEDMSYKQMLHTAGHELGHILGLDDTKRVGDLMGPLRLDRPIERATRDERDSLLAIRDQANLILRQVSGETEPEPSPAPFIAFVVPSNQAKDDAVGQDNSRIAPVRRSDTAVRRTVRNKKAESRAPSFRFGGMAF